MFLPKRYPIFRRKPTIAKGWTGHVEDGVRWSIWCDAYWGEGVDENGRYTLVSPKDWWDNLGILATSAHERVDYPTQKPEKLLERVIKASSNEGSIVLDCFCGSGTTLAVAEKLKRKWIGCDINKNAIDICEKRINKLKQ